MAALYDLLPPPDAGRLAVYAAGEEVDRAAFVARVHELADRLTASGVRAGQPVAVSLPNGADLVAMLFAVWKLDAVYVPVNPRLTEAERLDVFELTRPALWVNGIDTFVPLPDPMTHDPDVAAVSFTSGTTGRPKPVLMNHSGVLTLMDGVIGTLKAPAGGSGAGAPAKVPMPNLIPVSLSLWAGIYQVIFAFRVGAGVVVLPRFETHEFATLVARFGIRSTVLPPAAMTMLADDETISTLTPLKYVRSISSPLSPLQARRFKDRFGIAVMNCYGQTEIGGEIIGWNAADVREFGESHLGAVGKPHRGVSVRAVGNDGQSLPIGETGELWVMTPAISAGYADGRQLADRLSPDGWFRTGDIGRVDAEGFVWIEGRVSDMINRGGLKVYPAEVVEVLQLHPRVTDAAVVGVPDDRLGEVPVAFVVGSARADELEALCREHVAPYKVPVRFITIDALPRNDVGKVLNNVLVARASG
ncbi:MAG: class I adenylate-forming enzyme family protein [Acidimicrobiia bacterium]